ncbi:MAG: type IV secretion protein Rhs [Gemmatimonadaceae bacterium]|jgi:uncharacterized protein involved in type VI secretion and phage assembly|nr:type IV secretion protein Rhs [Gemmatimonadaceae bacterium]
MSATAATAAPVSSQAWFGTYVALVSDLRDPDGLGRVKVTLPWVSDPDDGSFEVWARVATLMAGQDRGTWFIPDVDDEVLVAFGHGDPRHPYVIGALWNGVDSPPESMDGGGRNTKKVIRSRNGVKVTLDDEDGREQFIVETPGGQKLTLKDGPASIEAADSHGNAIKLDAGGITVNASATVTIQAAQVKVSAAMVTVEAGMSSFSGIVKADTIITNSVVSASYTPGAGNIW